MSRLDWDKAKRRPGPRTPLPIVTWWWIPARRHSRCADCGNALEQRSRVAYSHVQGVVLCQCCVEVRGVSPEASKAWRLQAGRKR